MAKALMVLGTSSHVGKSVLSAALCRLLFDCGYRVAPFKAQNMSNNSYVTPDGLEIARAQALQALACGLEPEAAMNPVLLKPSADQASQVVLMGRPIGSFKAREYHGEISLRLRAAVEEAYRDLEGRFEVIVIEGAGSPAEVNLRDVDLANSFALRVSRAKALLVADIDRGGALAAVVGTLELMEPNEREQVEGILINKFRGDLELLKPALDFLERRTERPVLGVIPYLRGLALPEEDSVSLERREGRGGEGLRVAALKLPRISNHTDLEPLTWEEGLSLRYAEDPSELDEVDLLVIPGSKSTVEDLRWLRERGFEEAIKGLRGRGTFILGICGGFQMLGDTIEDPHGVESPLRTERGLGLLRARTVFERSKVTRRVRARTLSLWGIDEEVEGYEVHMGRTEVEEGHRPFRLTRLGDEEVDLPEGAVSEDGMVLGTYIHGLFELDGFRKAFLREVARRRGKAFNPSGSKYRERVSRSLREIAAAVASSIDLQLLGDILGLSLENPYRSTPSSP